MKHLVLVPLLFCADLRAESVALSVNPGSGPAMLMPANLEKWAADNGVTKETSAKFVDAIRDHGKADAEACQARAAALIRFLSRKPEDFLRQPKPYLEKALLLAGRAFEDDPSIPDPAPMPPTKAPSACPDRFKVQSSGDTFVTLAQIYPKFLVPDFAKRQLFQVSLPLWALSLDAALRASCPPKDKPGLFEDFEGRELYGVVPYSDKDRSALQVDLADDPLAPKNRCLKLMGPLKGWGYGAFFESHFATRPLGKRSKFSARFLTSQALDIYVKFGENSEAPGASEKWGMAKNLHLPASAQWQKVEIPLEGLVEEENYQGEKGWAKSGNGRLDLDSLQRVEIFVNKGEKQSAELYVDDLEFK